MSLSMCMQLSNVDCTAILEASTGSTQSEGQLQYTYTCFANSATPTEVLSLLLKHMVACILPVKTSCKELASG